MCNNSKRVLIVATVVKTHIMQFQIPTLKLFKDMGWETAVAARNDYDNPEDCQIPYCDRFYDVPFARFPFKTQNVECYKMLQGIIAQENCQIVHCHTPVGGVLGRLAARKARKAGTRVMYTAHGFHFFKGAPLTNWLLYYPAEKICSSLTDDLITINQEDYHLAKEKFASAKIHYIPGVGVDTAVFSPDRVTAEDRDALRAELGIEPACRMILSVGEFIPRKNYHTAIDAIAKLKNENIRYVVCGQGVQLPEIKEYAKKQGVEDRVVFLGYRNDVSKICTCADVFLHASYQEGLPVAVMEAMACGTPVVVSRIRGNVDLVENGVNGFLCDPQDADGFANRIREILDDSALAQKFRSVGLKKIQGYDMGVVTQQLRAIYSEVSDRLGAEPM